MYVKLSIRNARRSAKDYLIYFVTLTLSVSFFYAFSSLSSSNYELITSMMYNLDNFYTYLSYATYFISFVMIFLVYQVNKYMIRRRKREFATYILLGISQTKVAFMFFIECLLMLLGSIVMGILLGALFSQVLTLLIVVSVESTIPFGFRLYPDTILQTIIYFGVLFVVIGLFNVRHLRQINLIDMFYDEKKMEVQLSKGNWHYGLAFLFSVVCFIAAFIAINKYLQVQHFISVDVSVKNRILLVIILGIILGTYTLFYSLAFIIVFMKKHFKKLRYKQINLVLLGSLLSRINTTSMMMATVTLTLLGSVSCFVVAPVLSDWAKGFLAYRSVFDVQIDSVYNSIYEKKDLPNIDYSKIYNYLEANKYNVKESVELEMYLLNEEDFLERRKSNFPPLAISLSDFNQLRKMAGYEPISLQDNQFAMHWDKGVADQKIAEFIEEQSSILIGEHSFQTNPDLYFKESLGETVFNSYNDYTIVLPDQACFDLLTVNTNFYANTETPLDFHFAEGLSSYVDTWFRENHLVLYEKYEGQSDFKNFIDTRTKTVQLNEGATNALLIRIVGLYGGTVLLIICLTLLALQQLSDSVEHRSRYRILQKLGVDGERISKLILRQIGIYFGIPALLSLLAFMVILFQFSARNNNEIQAYVGDRFFLINISISFAIFVGIFTSYFVATYLGFKRNLKQLPL